MIRENIYIPLLHFLFSYLVLHSLQYTSLSNPWLKSFDSFWLSFADNVTAKTHTFESLVTKIILSGSASVLSLTATAKTQCFVHINFHSTLQLINGISSNLQNLLRYFNGTVTAAFFQKSIVIIWCRLSNCVF